jgi:hypothetical protein
MAQENVRLRLQAADGSASEEYRVDNGRVEVRSLQSPAGYEPPESSWHRLTAHQLSTHVERNTVVAQWLERRLGWRHLLQACVSQEPTAWETAEARTAAEDYVDSRAA